MKPEDIEFMKSHPGLHLVKVKKESGGSLIVASVDGQLYALSPDREPLRDDGWHPQAELSKTFLEGHISRMDEAPLDSPIRGKLN